MRASACVCLSVPASVCVRLSVFLSLCVIRLCTALSSQSTSLNGCCALEKFWPSIAFPLPEMELFVFQQSVAHRLRAVVYSSILARPKHFHAPTPPPLSRR